MNLRQLLKMSRPRFWLYLGGTHLIGYSAGINQLTDYKNILFYVNLLYFLLIANIFLYGINDYFDEDTDQFNTKKKDKEILLQRSQKYSLKNVLLSVAILSTFVALIQRNFLITILFIVFLFLSFAYSAPPLRFKSKAFVDFISNALYIIPGIIGYLQSSHKLPNIAILIASLCWAFAMHLFSAIPDIEADSKAGLKTTAVVLGKNKSLLLCILFWLIFAVVLILNRVLYPIILIAIIYPAIPLLLLFKQSISIYKVYWFFPYLNGVLGFISYLWIIVSKW